MKKTLIISTLLVSALALKANAENSVAVVDTKYVLENAMITKTANEQMLELTKIAKAEVENQEKDLSAKQTDLLSKKSVLNSDTYSKKEQELKEEILSFRRKIKEAQAKLSIQNRQKKEQIAEIISNVVEKISKDKGYKVVVSKTFLMYNDESIEITKEVLKQVNMEKLPTVE